MESKNDGIIKLLIKSLFMIGMLVYCGHHILYGKYNLDSLRGYNKLLESKKNIVNEKTYDNLKKRNKISRLHSNNLDLDLLEEEIKKNIGVVENNEIVILNDDVKKI